MIREQRSDAGVRVVTCSTEGEREHVARTVERLGGTITRRGEVWVGWFRGARIEIRIRQ